MRTGRALDQFPLVFEQNIQISHIPLDRIRLPGALDPAADGIAALAASEAALPSETLLFNACGFWLRPDVGRWTCTMALAEGVAPCDQGDGLFVVHCHAREGLSNIMAGGDRVRVAVRAFRVYIDQAHLHGGERVLEIAVA